VEVSLEELQEMQGSVPAETDLRHALEHLLNDPRLTPDDRRLVWALLRTGCNVRLAAAVLVQYHETCCAMGSSRSQL
jgi:hypothetical protein